MPAQAKSAIPSRAREKAQRKYREGKARRACVEAVWKRAEGACECCGRAVYRPYHATSALYMGHVHEKRARSLGGDETDPSQCQLLCVRCHMPNGAHRRSVRASA